MTPVRNTPSKVPAPPIEATGAPRLRKRAEIEQIRADQDAEAAADIGERRGEPARQHERDERRQQRRRRMSARKCRRREPASPSGGRQRRRSPPRSPPAPRDDSGPAGRTTAGSESPAPPTLIARIVPGQSTVTGARNGTPKISTTSRETTRCSGSADERNIDVGAEKRAEQHQRHDAQDRGRARNRRGSRARSAAG